MRTINKSINLALIFTLIVLFFYAKTGFAIPGYTLRPNLINSDTYGNARLTKAARQLSDRTLVQNNQGLLSQLSEQQKRVLTHIFIEGKTGKETAKSMRITQPVVSIYKQIALARLRELVDPDKALVQNNQGLLSQLTEQQRKVLTHLFIEGKTQEEAAESMGITQQAVSNHKQIALIKLRELTRTMSLITINTAIREMI